MAQKDEEIKPGQFPKGKSGNPAGRPKGAKNKATLVKQAVAAEAEGVILDNLSEVLMAVIEKAKGGDMVAAKLILDRGLPLKKEGVIDPKQFGINIIVQQLSPPEEFPEKLIQGEYNVEE